MKVKPHILNVFPTVNLFIKKMMFPIKNIEDLKDLNELESLQNPVKVVREQDKLGKPNFHEDMKKFLNQVLNHLEILFKI